MPWYIYLAVWITLAFGFAVLWSVAKDPAQRLEALVVAVLASSIFLLILWRTS